MNLTCFLSEDLKERSVKNYECLARCGISQTIRACNFCHLELNCLEVHQAKLCKNVIVQQLMSSACLQA